MNKRIFPVILVVIGLVCFGGYLTVNKGKKDKEDKGGGVSNPAVQELYTQAMTMGENNELAKAKEVYRQIVNDHPDFKEIDTVQKQLEEVSMKIIFSSLETPDTVIHEVKAGDTLGKIAKEYNTTMDLIKRRNNLKSDTIRLGQRLSIWKGIFSIFVDKSQNTLMLKANEEVVKIYRVSTGVNNSTPVGTFIIANKLVDPVWYKSGAIIPPESSDNALGSRWMGFDIPGYGIHGTIEPDRIGQQITAGCVRMRKEDVEELYSLLPVGTKVTIVD